MNPAPAYWRKFQHPDGRSWEVSVEGIQLRIRLRADDGETFERTRKFGDGDEAERELSQLIDEQLQDGFEEISTPMWRAQLDTLVEHWMQDDPAFDAAALRERVLACTSPSAAEIVEQVMNLADRWVKQSDGSAVLDMDHALDTRAGKWLERHGSASLPALLLALRYPDNSAQMKVESILGNLRSPEALPALLSVIEHPAPNLANHLGGRPQHFPTHALMKLGVPGEDTRLLLVQALAREDFRVVDAAAHVLAEFSAEDRFFEPLVALSEQAKRRDGLSWCLMRAAETRRDPVLLPFLQWMQKSGKFKSGGYPERIAEAIAGLKAPPGQAGDERHRS